MSDDTTLDRVFARAQRIHERVTRAERAAYERGLRRGMAIARENHVTIDGHLTMLWGDAEAQMEREIEEAKR